MAMPINPITTFLLDECNMKLLVTLLVSSSLVFYLPASSAQITLGWLEPITIILDSQQLSIQAKIDSGADHSSIHASKIKRFEKNNESWVKFTTVNEFVIEAPIYREAQIKTKLVGFNYRPVILMDVCLGGVERKIEVNLINRAHFTKPVLIGRSALSGFVIDPNETDLTCEMSCQPRQNGNYPVKASDCNK